MVVDSYCLQKGNPKGTDTSFFSHDCEVRAFFSSLFLGLHLFKFTKCWNYSPAWSGKNSQTPTKSKLNICCILNVKEMKTFNFQLYFCHVVCLHAVFSLMKWAPWNSVGDNTVQIQSHAHQKLTGWESKWNRTKRNDTVALCSFLEITQTSMFQASAIENIFRQDVMDFRNKKEENVWNKRWNLVS